MKAIGGLLSAASVALALVWAFGGNVFYLVSSPRMADVPRSERTPASIGMSGRELECELIAQYWRERAPLNLAHCEAVSLPAHWFNLLTAPNSLR